MGHVIALQIRYMIDECVSEESSKGMLHMRFGP